MCCDHSTRSCASCIMRLWPAVRTMVPRLMPAIAMNRAVITRKATSSLTWTDAGTRATQPTRRPSGVRVSRNATPRFRLSRPGASFVSALAERVMTTWRKNDDVPEDSTPAQEC